MCQRMSEIHSSFPGHGHGVFFFVAFKPLEMRNAVDGRNSANQLIGIVYTSIYRVLYIPGGAEVLPSTVGRRYLFYGRQSEK